VARGKLGLAINRESARLRQKHSRLPVWQTPRKGLFGRAAENRLKVYDGAEALIRKAFYRPLAKNT
jgi:hypothetical protein